MIEIIKKLPDHVFGVKVKGEVTEVDLKEVLLPGLQELADTYGEIYYLLVLETDVKNFTAGAWVQDMLAGIKHFSKWKKMAVVSNQRGVRNFTDIVSAVVPGQAKGFSSDQLEEAKYWVSDDREEETGTPTSKLTVKNVAIALLGLYVVRRVLKKIF
ncbi:SpoIIAA-like [bacterium A37T11]|nr:SpoIIAA-like [bacterium A37T11]